MRVMGLNQIYQNETSIKMQKKRQEACLGLLSYQSPTVSRWLVWKWHGGGVRLTQYEKPQISQKVHFIHKLHKYICMYISGYQMQLMPFLHEIYFEIFGASPTVSKSPPCQSLTVYYPNIFKYIYSLLWKSTV